MNLILEEPNMLYFCLGMGSGVIAIIFAAFGFKKINLFFAGVFAMGVILSWVTFGIGLRATDSTNENNVFSWAAHNYDISLSEKEAGRLISGSSNVNKNIDGEVINLDLSVIDGEYALLQKNIEEATK